MKNRVKLLILTAFVFLFSTQSLSQELRGIRRGVATIIFSSIGGAVLGLSTLPFYGQPEEHTQNISNGALLGLVAGGAYLIYQAESDQQQSNRQPNLTIPQVYPHKLSKQILDYSAPIAMFHWEF